jgi:hypothetical protein
VVLRPQIREEDMFDEDLWLETLLGVSGNAHRLSTWGACGVGGSTHIASGAHAHCSLLGVSVALHTAVGAPGVHVACCLLGVLLLQLLETA